MRLNKRAAKLFCSMIGLSRKKEKKWNWVGGGIDKRLSKKDCFKRVTEEDYAKEGVR